MDVWAPSGCLFYTGEDVPSGSNRLLIGCLASQEIRVITIADSEAALPSGPSVETYPDERFDGAYAVASQPAMTDELGRIRHLEQAPDGTFYVITSNRDGRSGEGVPRVHDDRLVRLTAE